MIQLGISCLYIFFRAFIQIVYLKIWKYIYCFAGVEDTSTMESALAGLGLSDMMDRPIKTVWRRRLMLARKFELYGRDKKAAMKQKQSG